MTTPNRRTSMEDYTREHVWEIGATVCPYRFTEQGIVVEGTVVRTVSIPVSYIPPGFHSPVSFLYIVEWPAGNDAAPMARGFGCFFRNELLRIPTAIELAHQALKNSREEFLLPIQRKQRRLQDLAERYSPPK